MSSVPRPKSRSEQASEAFHEALRLDAKPRVGFGDDVVFKAEAARARATGRALLEAPPLREGAGEALAWDPSTGIPDRVIESLASTLECPNAIAVDASEKRMRALQGLDALEVALDAAHTAKAKNSFEKMLAHQLAAGHMDVLRLLQASRGDGLPPADAVRYVNTAARMMDVYQTGLLTLLKLKTKGQQQVIVQHVNIEHGGQAVVAGSIGGKSRRRGGTRKSGG